MSMASGKRVKFCPKCGYDGLPVEVSMEGYKKLAKKGK